MPVDDSNGWAYPGDLCCTLYDYTNYGGDSISFCLDETHSPKSWWLDNYGWDDRMESWVCGRNVAAYFCFDDETCKGNNSGEAGAGSMNNPDVRRNNWFSGVQMEYYDSAIKGALTIFEDPYC